MALIKRLAIVPAFLILLACSMDFEHPVFSVTDGDYIGQKLKITGLMEKGKPAEGFFQIHPSSDGSYYIATDVPPKFDDRYVLKAIKRVSGGIIYALQINTAPRPLWDGSQSKPRYEIYPIKISSFGEVTIYEFLHDSKALNSAKKRKIQTRDNKLSISLAGDFDNASAQCLVQDLINKDQYKFLNDKKPEPMKLIGYQAPKAIGIAGCE